MNLGIVLFIMFVGALVSGLIAANKRRSAVGWGLCGALFPLISMIIILALEPRAEDAL